MYLFGVTSPEWIQTTNHFFFNLVYTFEEDKPINFDSNPILNENHVGEKKISSHSHLIFDEVRDGIKFLYGTEFI